MKNAYAFGTHRRSRSCRRAGTAVPFLGVPMGVGLGLTAEEADDFGNADESTIREFIPHHLPTRIIEVGSSMGEIGVGLGRVQAPTSPPSLARPARVS